MFHVVFTKADSFSEGLDNLGYHGILQNGWVMIFLLNQFTPQNKFESILHLRLCPPVNHIGYFSPLVAYVQPLLKEVEVLAKAPLALVD